MCVCACMCLCVYTEFLIILNVKALIAAQSTGTVGLFLLLGKEYMYHQ